jgi:hypothetical protein
MIKFDRTWSQFILDVTIPTLLGRYNHRAPFDFINRIVSTKQSASPTKDHFMRYSQSVTVLMNNVLQKLNETENDQDKTRHARNKKRHSQNRSSYDN